MQRETIAPVMLAPAKPVASIEQCASASFLVVPNGALGPLISGRALAVVAAL